MIVTPIKTDKIVGGQTIFEILDEFVLSVSEGSVLAVTSKIVSICEGSVKKVDEVDKEKLIESESELFLPMDQNQYHVAFSIKNGLLAPNAGIDESNGNGNFILWPKDSQKSANEIREYLVKRFSLKNVGVIITDSKTTPLKWGTTGMALSHSGFEALKDYIGRPDIFGRNLNYTKGNVMEGLAAAAVLTMGEGNEQTPLALISEIPFVSFQQRNPTDEEIKDLQISLKDDLYADLLNGVKWKKGKNYK